MNKDEIIHIVLHHFVEFVCVVGITVIACVYMSVGGFETPIILGAIGAIVGIAGIETFRKVKEGKE